MGVVEIKINSFLILALGGTLHSERSIHCDTKGTFFLGPSACCEAVQSSVRLHEMGWEINHSQGHYRQTTT
jgi:hypothetical protein